MCENMLHRQGFFFFFLLFHEKIWTSPMCIHAVLLTYLFWRIHIIAYEQTSGWFIWQVDFRASQGRHFWGLFTQHLPRPLRSLWPFKPHKKNRCQDMKYPHLNHRSAIYIGVKGVTAVRQVPWFDLMSRLFCNGFGHWMIASHMLVHSLGREALESPRSSSAGNQGVCLAFELDVWCEYEGFQQWSCCPSYCVCFSFHIHVFVGFFFLSVLLEPVV